MTKTPTPQNKNVREHISKMWGKLQRFTPSDTESIIGLPYPYIVPGGKFDEQFYWDSYFIMLGLAADKRWDMVENMLKNTAHLIDRFGFVPTANRPHFLSRSQPPFFALMVELLAMHKGDLVLQEYLPQMLKEYDFWMSGHEELDASEYKSFARLVQMPNGTFLNRYYDNLAVPRAEAFYADESLSKSAIGRQSDRLFLHLRAGAESGWDFSSRWCLEPQKLNTIHTADIVPIDLNCLLYKLEVTIAKACRLSGDDKESDSFDRKAAARSKAIEKYCWNQQAGFFYDYNFHHQKHTDRKTLATVFPLFIGIATPEQAKQIAHNLESKFLQKGGFLTTLEQTSQQWDSPNGWAPLQWIAIQGLRKYDYTELANTVKDRWIAMNKEVFEQTGKLIEKYSVIPGDHLGLGGEYPLQEGFGWTNGVLASLLPED